MNKKIPFFHRERWEYYIVLPISLGIIGLIVDIGAPTIQSPYSATDEGQFSAAVFLFATTFALIVSRMFLQALFVRATGNLFPFGFRIRNTVVLDYLLPKEGWRKKETDRGQNPHDDLYGFTIYDRKLISNFKLNRLENSLKNHLLVEFPIGILNMIIGVAFGASVATYFMF